MSGRTIREIERQANEQAGIELKYEAAKAGVGRDGVVFEELTYSTIAQALANRYDSIYYVNLDNNHYVEYVSSAEYRDLKVETGGEDFFEDSARNIRRVVHPEDQPFALMVHRKEYIIEELDKENMLSFTYRIMFEGKPYYYNGRITRGTGDDRNHLIIGWSNVDSEVKRERAFEAAREETRLTRNINKALISDYVKVCYVDLRDNSFAEFQPSALTGELMEERVGSDFFEDVLTNTVKQIYHRDADRFVGAFQKENLLALMKEAPFIITYRLLQHGKPVWHTLKALYADEGTHMLIAIRNIDIQKRREADFEHKLHSMAIQVNRDSMTSVKNKNAFSQEEHKWDQILADGEEIPAFAIVVCDVNDVAKVNEREGTQAGDALIIAASKLISDTFKHSPVFRIGSDEFAVVLTGHDYIGRSSLLGEMEDKLRHSEAIGGLSIACGTATFDKDRDESFGEVFDRADSQMYARKQDAKGGLR